LVICDEVLQRMKLYIDFVRTKLTPKCDYLLICKNGNQLFNLGDIFGRMVYQAIGKYINPTRYRQIIETESAKDQKHTSNVAKVHYQKQISREVARKSNKCMQKLIEIGESKVVENRKSIFEITSEESDKEEEKEDSDDTNLIKDKPLPLTIKQTEKEKFIESKRRKKCPFTKEEDNFLIKGMKKYGVGKWTSIL